MTRDLPTSTYRYQLSSSFTLDDAAGDLPRLVELGIDAVYLSPVLTSTRGSDHGYDWVDCREVDPQRGGEPAWSRFIGAAQQAQLKVILDIVPNHCGIADPAQNPYWWSVLREGRNSPYAHWFDIDWATGPILLPVLGEDGDLSGLVLSQDATELDLAGRRLPVATGTAAPGDDPISVAARQHYRLAPWPSASTELNYRRFFTVDSLAGLRLEDESVFDATHERIFRMVDQGELHGLRIDHPDGLRDPGQYFQRLRARVGDDLWLLAEKILGDGEPMPDWAIDGTTGYDALAELTRVFTRPASEARITASYRTITGDPLDVAGHVLAGKRTMINNSFGSEVNRILRCLPEPMVSDARVDLRAALVELAIHVPVYRSYVPTDRRPLDETIATTLRLSPDMAAAVGVLAPVLGDAGTEASRRFEQLTGARTAKGLEDTAWDRYSRYLGANEVGGHPDRFATTLAGFHDDLTRRHRDLPHSMTTLSTHDTKRSEDVRAAMAALTEVPEALGLWSAAFADATDIPDRSFAHLLAQTLAAIGPIERDRLHAYATKAMREAGTATSWTAPNEGFEQTVHDGVDLAHDDPVLRQQWLALRRQISAGAISNVLSQKLVQLTMPGIPDVYWGSEIIHEYLVDPDNRQIPDFARIIAAAHSPLQLAQPTRDGAKHWVVEHALRLRRANPTAFDGYQPIMLDGPLQDHLIAFSRGGAITLATRMPITLRASGGWGEAAIDLAGRWTNVFTGTRLSGRCAVGKVLDRLPVALLVRG